MNNAFSETPKGRKHKPYLVSEDENGMRLDRWFRKHFPRISYIQLQKLLRTGQVRLDGKRAKSEARIKSGQKVRLPPFLYEEKWDADKGSKQPSLPLSQFKRMILYQDNDVIIINKPAGMAVQGGTGIKRSIDDFLRALGSNGIKRPKLVHRLDRDTSGVLVIARNDFSAVRLTRAFREHEAKKIYWAVVWGKPNPAQGKIENILVKCGKRITAQNVGKTKENAKAKKAVTTYKVIETAIGKASLVELCPLTGRTHQLRTHMSQIGTPIIGDRIYGKKNPSWLSSKWLDKRLYLHARRIILPHPRQGIIDITAPLEDKMKLLFDILGFSKKLADEL